jgi:hypothetical protein
MTYKISKKFTGTPSFGGELDIFGIDETLEKRSPWRATAAR